MPIWRDDVSRCGFVAAGAVSSRRLLSARGGRVTKPASHTGSTSGRRGRRRRRRDECARKLAGASHRHPDNEAANHGGVIALIVTGRSLHAEHGARIQPMSSRPAQGTGPRRQRWLRKRKNWNQTSELLDGSRFPDHPRLSIRLMSSPRP
jgi:hypothetical protein